MIQVTAILSTGEALNGTSDKMLALDQKVGQQTPSNIELTNKQTNWYRFRIFRDDRHRGDLPRGETRITKDIRMACRLYAKVKIAFSKVSDNRNHIRFGS
jgi:hypothetical protein